MSANGHDGRRHRARAARSTSTRRFTFPIPSACSIAAFTYYTGFKVNADEYKVMGLAPYGEPKYAQTILDHLIDLKPDGTSASRRNISTTAPD